MQYTRVKEVPLTGERAELNRVTMAYRKLSLFVATSRAPHPQRQAASAFLGAVLRRTGPCCHAAAPHDCRHPAAGAARPRGSAPGRPPAPPRPPQGLAAESGHPAAASAGRGRGCVAPLGLSPARRQAAPRSGWRRLALPLVRLVSRAAHRGRHSAQHVGQSKCLAGPCLHMGAVRGDCVVAVSCLGT